MNKLLGYYRQLLAKNRRWFLAILGIFFLGFVAGFLISFVAPSFTRLILAQYAASIDPNLQPGANLTWYLLSRNVGIVGVSTIGGFVFGLLPVGTSFLNGLLLGALIGFGEIYQVINPVQLALLILPHGIFEYLGSFLALGFGLKLGLNWLSKSSRGKRVKVFVQDLKEVGIILPLIILLLGVAALIEGNLTNSIACFFSGICGE
jgi:uncharacterized membrane protein SpoIIM required for sporulation